MAFPEALALAFAIAAEAASALILADRAFYPGHFSSVTLFADEQRANY